jgi:HD-like signal output (HDOD) protein
MTSLLHHGTAWSGILKGKDDYTRTVLLTELLADHLPHLPWFLRDLQCALEDSSTVLERVCTALEAHPRICANFIRIGCMAEPAQPISIPIDQLVVLLGKRRVWTTAVAALLLHELNSTWSNTAQKQAASIGLARANTALALARAAEDPFLEQAYVSGILAVAGLLPLLYLSGVTDHVPDWLDLSPEAVQKQREIFGTDSLELGRWARLLWKLPLENSGTEVMCESAPALSYFQTLPKDSPRPVAALNSGAESRNLVLVLKGTV